MHLIVPFASVMSEARRAATRELALPHLARALSRMDLQWLATPAGADPQAPELSLTPPHEHVRALALGLPVKDGCVPWAALEAARQGLEVAGRAWGRLTPAHWQLGTEQLTMLDPQLLDLDVQSSAVLLEAVRTLFESEGFELHAAGPRHWLVAHPSLADLPCASLDRVIGRNVDLWLAADPRARLLRRLQNEVQMLLYTHPLNEEREARGALPVNSFWLDGCGIAPAALLKEAPALMSTFILDERLRTPALNDDGLAWSGAFAQLDEGPIAQALHLAGSGQAVQLSLCGERQACTLTARTLTRWQRLRNAWQAPSMPAVHRLLEAL